MHHGASRCISVHHGANKDKKYSLVQLGAFKIHTANSVVLGASRCISVHLGASWCKKEVYNGIKSSSVLFGAIRS